MQKKAPSSGLTLQERELGLDAQISRRDFVGGGLIGAGAALLGVTAAPSAAGTEGSIEIPRSLSADWTGYGGVGDYARSNGNTHDVVNAAHAVRDGKLGSTGQVGEDTHEAYDLVIVGGGFSGMGAAHTFAKESGAQGRCLVLDNHPIFGGEAKQNEFVVDGHRLYGPQGSNSFVTHADGSFPDIWRELRLPEKFAFQPLAGTQRPIRVAPDNFAPMMKWPARTSVGYFFPTADGKGRWIVGAQEQGFADAPLAPDLKRDLNAALQSSAKLRSSPPANWEAWLDSMTYQDFLVRELGLNPDVLYRYVDPYFGAASFGISGDAVSAYGAYKLQMPGTLIFLSETERKAIGQREYVSFPAGNTTILRHLVKAVIPSAIDGAHTAEGIAYGRTRFDKLDRPGQTIRIRASSTAVRLRHADGPQRQLTIDYYRGGRLERLHARSAVIAVSGQIARRIVGDLPPEFANAYKQFHHAPMLVVNVALRHWRFMERLGISAARWFEGFGWFANFRQPMILGTSSQPLDPSQPIVLTLYVPYTRNTGRSLQEQVVLGRSELFATSYRDFELQIRAQLTRLFGDHGFDARRDIAAIVLNRWGHAYVVPQPGFYFGVDGAKPPRAIIAAGFGKIAFGHSELTGFQAWSNGYSEGRRAALAAISSAESA
jgi:spermidine dehydrogenase